MTASGRAVLGVTVRTVTGSSGGQPVGVGVGVVDVTSGGAADAAGIRLGDVIVSVDDQQAPIAPTLSAVLADLDVGQQVSVTVQRDGQQQQYQVTLGELG